MNIERYSHISGICFGEMRMVLHGLKESILLVSAINEKNRDPKSKMDQLVIQII
jgi:hypothetical protein